MQAGAAPPDLAGQKTKGDQAARVVGPMRVLADAHAPEDHHVLRPADGVGDSANHGCVYAAKRGDALRSIVFDQGRQSLVILHSLTDEGVIDAVFFDEDVHDRVVESYIGRRLEPAIRRGELGDVGPRGSMTISFVPRRAACLKNVAATGWFTVVFVPVNRTTSAYCTSP